MLLPCISEGIGTPAISSTVGALSMLMTQSLRTVPLDLTEASYSLRLGPWMRFWKLEVPFAMPALIWNMMMSMAGGWFFVVASEAISVGDTTVALPGVGSWIALAIEQRDLPAIGLAVLAMMAVILIFDQFLFRPLIAWADRFRFVQESEVSQPTSWVLTMLRRSRVVEIASRPVADLWSLGYRFAPKGREWMPAPPGEARRATAVDRLWQGAVLLASLAGLWAIGRFLSTTLTLADVLQPVLLGGSR